MLAGEDPSWPLAAYGGVDSAAALPPSRRRLRASYFRFRSSTEVSDPRAPIAMENHPTSAVMRRACFPRSAACCIIARRDKTRHMTRPTPTALPALDSLSALASVQSALPPLAVVGDDVSRNHHHHRRSMSATALLPPVCHA